MPSHEFKEWSQCTSFTKNGGIELISKDELNRRMKEKQAAEQNTSNLSPETLEHMADTKRKVDAGLLPKYIGGTTEQSNPEIEKQAKRFLDFSRILAERKSRNEY